MTQFSLGLSTVSIFMAIRAPVVWLPSPYRLAPQALLDGTVDAMVTPRARAPVSYRQVTAVYGRMTVQVIKVNVGHRDRCIA
ncbi:hypothetical protein F5888DRAFT_1679034 [Russula emetica]|nr:hypothetical protein F5888DRAFT_1679034 [Russula emetica]